MQKKTAKECEDQVLIIIILSFCNQPTESLLNNFLCSFSDTMCGVDAWRKGENQKIVGFSLYEVLLLPICEICLFCPHFFTCWKGKRRRGGEAKEWFGADGELQYTSLLWCEVIPYVVVEVKEMVVLVVVSTTPNHNHSTNVINWTPNTWNI